MDREQLKYGTDYTSVKVRQEPGGKSSINLGWQDPKRSKYAHQVEGKSYQRGERNDYSKGVEQEHDYRYEVPKKSNNREYQYSDYNSEYLPSESKNTKAGGRGNEYEKNYDAGYNEYTGNYERNYDSGKGYDRNYEYSQGSDKNYEYRRVNERNIETGKQNNKRNEEYTRGKGKNYEEPDRGYERNYNDYGRGGADSYGRNAERNNGYAEEEYGRGNQNRRQPQGERQGNVEYEREYRGQENERSNYNRRNDDYGYTRNNYTSNEPYYNDRRPSKQQPKTSVKVQNPPGGQSSFIFG